MSLAPPPRRRIAIVSHTHPSISKGGAEIAAYTLFTGLLELGIEALFIAACSERERAKLVLGSKHERAIFYAPERYEPFYHLSPSPFGDQLRALLKAERVALVNFHHFLNVGMNAVRAVALDRNIAAWVTLHEYLAICHHHGQMVTYPKRSLCESGEPARCVSCFPEFSQQQFMHRRQLMLETLCQAKGVISPSRFLAKRMMDWGLPRDRIEVIDNGVKLENAGRASGEPQPKRRRIFGYFGQITPFKGLDVLLDAAEILARSPASTENIGIRIHGNLVGVSGEFRERFENLVKSLPILEYTGAYSNDDVHKLMCECDYVVIPSVWWENSPLVIQEAFAAKCPVICTGIGGLQEKIEHGRTGFHFRRGDASDLARTITEAMGDGVLETLRSGLPAPRDPLTMARDYLAAFERFAQRESCSSGKPN